MKTLLRTVLPLLILAGGFGLRTWLIATGPELQSQDAPHYAPQVDVLVVRPGTTRPQLTAYGEVRPRSTTTVVAEVAARVLEVSPKLYRGAFFEAGEVLLKLDDHDLGNAVAMAQAELDKADAALLLEEAEARIAVADWEQLGEGPVPGLVAREPQLAVARANRAAAVANLDIARTNLERTVLRAPFDGRTLQRQVEIGAWVAPGQQLAAIYSIDAAEVALPFAASQLRHLGLAIDGPGEPLPVILEADGGGNVTTWHGRIVRTEASVNPGTRMLTAIAQVDDPFRPAADGTPALAPGMFLRATVAGRELHDVFRVPRRAVLDGDFVVLVDDSDKAHKVPVEVLFRAATECIIGSGLQSGDRLVVNTLPLFVEGMDVKILATVDGEDR
jgi:RND family efflux transporter MFP subunit